jgi:hypothetical protein
MYIALPVIPIHQNYNNTGGFEPFKTVKKPSLNSTLRRNLSQIYQLAPGAARAQDHYIVLIGRTAWHNKKGCPNDLGQPLIRRIGKLTSQDG